MVKNSIKILRICLGHSFDAASTYIFSSPSDSHDAAHDDDEKCLYVAISGPKGASIEVIVRK